MLPPLSPEQMIDMLSQANVFIQMSETATNGDKEGLPNVLLEAMSLELPILSTLHAGIPDIVLNGVNGILCEEKNEDAYLMGFREIVTWGLCPQNRERIVKHFSLTAHMQKLEELYTKILNSGYTKVAD
jgi:glycosyltransferase involved in cell wall biosynthesis